MERIRKYLDNRYVPRFGWVILNNSPFHSQQSTFSSPITVILGNTLIIIALHKESSLHPPYKLFCQCLATTDPLVGLVIHPPMLPTGCPWFTKTGVFVGLWYSIITISSGLVISVVSSQRLSALSVIIRLKYKIMFNNGWANQMHWTWRDIERQCTMHCGCS